MKLEFEELTFEVIEHRWIGAGLYRFVVSVCGLVSFPIFLQLVKHGKGLVDTFEIRNYSTDGVLFLNADFAQALQAFLIEYLDERL